MLGWRPWDARDGQGMMTADLGQSWRIELGI